MKIRILSLFEKHQKCIKDNHFHSHYDECGGIKLEVIDKIINNAWFVSLVAGIIVYFLTDGLNKMKINKEYSRNVQQVTKDVLHMLQEFIVENKLPEPYLLNSYYIATCKSYAVETKDADSIEGILNILIKEIFDSSFLPKEDKIRYCQEIEKTKEDLVKIEVEIGTTDIELSEREIVAGRNRRILSAILSTITTCVVLYVTLMDDTEGGLFSNISVNGIMPMTPIILIVIALGLFVAMEWRKVIKR